MADMRRFGPLDLLMLLLVFATAAGARTGYLLTCGDGGNSDGPLRVQASSPLPGAARAEQEILIDNVRTSLWFGSPAPFSSGEETTAHLSPGYPYLVGLLGRYVPEEQLASSVRWGQVGLGALTAVFYFLFARRAFRSLTVGTLAGLLAALHPFWIVGIATLEDGTLASFALGGVLFLASQAGEKGGPLRSLLLGLALAGLALVRATCLPLSFVLLVWFLLRSRALRLGWLCALCAFLGFGTGLAPWTVRNYQVFSEPVPVVSSTYLHLWIGNNPRANGGPLTEEMWETAPVRELQQIPGQPARYARLGREVAQTVQDQPAESLRRRLLAALTFVFGQRWLLDGTLAEVTPAGSQMPEWLASSHAVILQGTLLALLVLTFLGWRWSYGWRYESIPAALAMMWLPLPYFLSHGGLLSGARLPLDGVLLCFSAFALCCLLPTGGTLLAGAESSTTTTSEQRDEYPL